jgi:molybdopterin-binding protein
MKAGARNQIVGTVKSVKNGNIMSLVKVDVPAKSQLASVMTVESVEDMGLKEGDKVRVIIKAVSVLLVKE